MTDEQINNEAELRTEKAYMRAGYFGGKAISSGKNSPVRGIKYFDWAGKKKFYIEQIKKEQLIKQ